MNETAQHFPVPQGVAYAISPEDVEHCWSAVEQLLQIMEGWTQCLSAADIRSGIATGKLRLWSVIDRSGVVSVAITKIRDSGRGLVCTLWLLASPLADDPSIATLVEKCESMARQAHCIVLQINALPGWVQRLAGKLTAIVYERDLVPRGRPN